MRRLLTWHLPIAGSLVAVGLCAYGFTAYLRGDTGSPVNLVPRPETRAPAARDVVAPLVLGDSLAHGTGDEEGLGISGRLDAELRRRGIHAKRTYNIAINGARTKNLIELLDHANVRELLREANVIVVSIGGNDLWGGTDWRDAQPPDPDAVMDEVLGRIETIVETIRTINPKARIVFIGLYNPFASTPMGPRLTALVRRWNARLLTRFRDDPNFTLLETADIFAHHDRLALDRFHPGAEGYAIIARRIAEGI